MSAALIVKFIREIVIVGLAALLLLSMFYIYAQSQQKQLITSDYELQITNERLETTEQIAQMERKHYEQNIKAANEYQEREQVIIADAASARDAVTSLSVTLSEVTAKAATDANFQRDALAVTANSLETCSGRYSELATTTDRLANSLRAAVEANKQ